jgi:hypothetical protein
MRGPDKIDIGQWDIVAAAAATGAKAYQERLSRKKEDAARKKALRGEKALVESEVLPRRVAEPESGRALFPDRTENFPWVSVAIVGGAFFAVLVAFFLLRRYDRNGIRAEF